MAYYPKNKIITDQTATMTMTDSNGNSFQYLLSSNRQTYIGKYYTLSTGESYTGRFPNDGNNELLIYSEISVNENISYSGLTYTSPQSAFSPTEDDYKKGFFIRYFTKKRNEFIFQELTQNEYNEANNPKNINYVFYKPFSIKWLLNGTKEEVTEFNQYSIIKAEEQEKVYGLNEFLQMNYLQYYK